MGTILKPLYQGFCHLHILVSILFAWLDIAALDPFIKAAEDEPIGLAFKSGLKGGFVGLAIGPI